MMQLWRDCFKRCELMWSPCTKGLARTLIGSDMHCTQLAETSGDILLSSTGTLDTAFLKILHYTYHWFRGCCGAYLCVCFCWMLVASHLPPSQAFIKSSFHYTVSWCLNPFLKHRYLAIVQVTYLQSCHISIQTILVLYVSCFAG